MRAGHALLALLSIFAVCDADYLIGCKYENSLCEDSETCADDNLFGRCLSDPAAFDGYKYDLSDLQEEVITAELEALVANNADWADPITQCVILYFELSVRFEWDHNPEFCNVQRPEDVLVILQLIENELVNDVSAVNQELQISPNTGNGPADVSGANVYDVDQLVDRYDKRRVDNVVPLEIGGEDRANVLDTVPVPEDFGISQNEESDLADLLQAVMNGDEVNTDNLSTEELDRFYRFLSAVLQTLPPENAKGERVSYTIGEVLPVDYEPTNDSPDDTWMFKKDDEVLGSLDVGIGSKPHKIVKGDQLLDYVEALANKNRQAIETTKIRQGLSIDQKQGGQLEVDPAEILAALEAKKHNVTAHSVLVDSNRVYLKFDKDLTDQRVKALAIVKYLESKLGLPPSTLDNVKVNGTEISFDVVPTQPHLNGTLVALRAKKYKQDIQNNAKVNLLEAGLGSREKRISVDEAVDNSDDSFVLPTLIVCGLVVGVLIVVLGVYVIKARSRARDTLMKLSSDLEAQPSKDYQELCRQRMSDKPQRREPLSGILGALATRLGAQMGTEKSDQHGGQWSGGGGAESKTSSTSSWCEEPATTNMDISTGHMILTYMEEHLCDKHKLDAEWAALQAYQPEDSDVSAAKRSENAWKNRYQDVLPYDHCRVLLSDAVNQYSSDYVNASAVTDHDPRNPAYIATQGPLAETSADLWQMVWEQGAVILVTLTKLSENGEAKCHRYWPENGSEVYGDFEVHLVSEHIWCEDYLVRSFYLKNVKTNETRTVTQFHFLSWPDHGVPGSVKALLEFRRKVNKSYRGRSCPIVVHCSDGAGRTGTFCLLDMVLNRINKGVKEIDIAATLEHLRDQRMKMVDTREQFEFVLTCVAEEVQAILKSCRAAAEK